MKRLLFPVVLAALFVLALATGTALAARGHVFERTVGQLGPGAGELNSPQGVAVNEETGDVYVADAENHRIDEFTSSGDFVRAWGYDVVASGPGNKGANEQQGLLVKASGGKFSLTLETANGAGNLTSGSNTVTGVSTGLGAFHAGDAISGTGIPANTTVTAVGSGTLTISANATSPGRVLLAAKENTGATAAGNLTELSPTVSGIVMRSGEFAVGERISGTGIPAGTEITACSPSCANATELTLSNPVEAGKTASAVALTATDIPYNATEAELKSALEALPGVGSGNVTASRVEKTVTEFEDKVTFSGGPLAGNDIAPASATTTNLEGTKAVTVSTPTLGGGIEVCEAAAIPADACKAGVENSTLAGNSALSSPALIAIDNNPSSPSHGDLYIAAIRGTSIQKLSPAGVEVGSPITEAPPGTPFSISGCFVSECGIRGLAVDSSGDLWVANRVTVGAPFIDRFDDAIANSFLSPAQRISTAGEVTGLAIDAPNLYFTLVSNGASVGAFKYTASGEFGESIPGQVGRKGGATAVATDLANGDVYVGFGGALAHVTAENQPVESFGEGHLTRAAGIAVDGAAKSTAYVTDSTGGTLAIFAPEPPGSPLVSNAFPKSVAVTTATLRASVNPRSELSEESTAYRFEYGPCSSLEACEGAPYPLSAPLPNGSVAPDFEVHNVTATLEGLEASTPYHFRVRAENAHGVETGEERTFSTQAMGLGFTLPDGRVWEQVTPGDKQGGLIYPANEGIIQAAADGNGLTYLSFGTVVAGGEGSRNSEAIQNLAWRAPGGVWDSQAIAPRHSRGTGPPLGNALEYRAFSSDLARAALEPRDQTPLSEYTSESTPYLREDLAEPASYLPLVVGCPAAGEPCPRQIEEHANVPPGTEFGGGSQVGTPGAELNPLPAIRYAAVTPDLSHALLASRVALTAGGKSGLYEWSAGQLRVVGVLPDGEVLGGANYEASPAVRAEVAGGETGRRNAISADGSHVFWEKHERIGSSRSLYLRYNATQEQSALNGSECIEAVKACTLRLDEVQPGASGSGPSEPLFQAAGADGSRAFFTDTQQLTADSGAASGKPDLYECETQLNGAGQLECKLTDLTPKRGSESAVVQGILPGFAQDGSTVYFVADGVLTGQPSATGEMPAAGVPNLYVRHYDAQSGEWEPTKLIAVLSGADSNDWGANGEALKLSAEASPNGRYLAFVSQRSLTGYDNHDAVSENSDEEVYRYDGEADGGAGELTCVSCNPTGALPAGRRLRESGLGSGEGGSEVTYKSVDRIGSWDGSWVAAITPDAQENLGAATSTSQPRYVFDSGRVFFNAIDSLVPADSNGNWDAYEYESSTGCSATSAAAASAGGCVALLSSGTASGGAGFLEASASGDDAFFITSAPLSVLDEDPDPDIYDARVDGVAATAKPAPECLGEACQPAAEAPIDRTPASSSFEGSGNVRESSPKPRCAKGKRRVQRNGKAHCAAVKSHKRKHAAHKRHHRRAARHSGGARR